MQQNNLTNGNNRSFTIIELLVVLALVAILSVVVILTLNPAELIKQARDSNRLSDLSTINTALNLFSADATSGFMGTSTVVYVSLPDNTSSTCGSWGLPTLPSGYTYNCVTLANLRNTNGTGWIPVNFQRISSNSPISQLPVDPINTTSTRLYYTYVSGGSWELSASIEASKNKLGGSNDLVSKDGGSAASQYEVGNNLTLSPIETGDSSLVGYWNFDEGSGTISYDRSGLGNNGSLVNSPTWSSGKIGRALSFSGNYVQIPNTSNISFGGSLPFTISAWINNASPGASGYANIATKGFAGSCSDTYSMYIMGNGDRLMFQTNSGGGCGGIRGIYTNPSLSANTWYHVSELFDGRNLFAYINGVLQDTLDNSSNLPAINTSDLYIGMGASGTQFWNGLIDDVRVYNRALSAAEISALYNAAK